MCGIAGIVSLNDISGNLYGAIKSLEYRGYDSCGMALIDGAGKRKSAIKVAIRKNIGSVDEVRDRERFSEMRGNIGIAHTRWATHGGVTSANAHPHASCDGAFAITHNGIISNYGHLRDQLKGKGHTFLSETDTEVIVHLIEEHYKTTRQVESAFVAALKELQGTFAVAMITRYDPERIYCARNESPLIIGISPDAHYIGSDFNAFIANTKTALIMDDNEYAVITHDSYALKRLSDGIAISRSVQEIQWDPEMSQKGGFPHYMLKEIYEQPQVVHHALDIDPAAIRALAEKIVAAKRLYFTGVGTTFYVVQLGQYYFSRYAGITPSIVSSDEFRFLASIDSETMTIAASQSGETYDTLTALRHAKSKGGSTAAIVNVMGSSMARIVDHLILQGSGPEISVISTKAAVSQMIILTRLALETGLLNKTLSKKQYDKHTRELRKLPDLIEKIVNERSGFIHTIARSQAHINHWLFLGRGHFYPIARESALKMKEVSYLHAEGMPSGFLKHGTIALIDERLNSVVFVPPKEEGDLYTLTLSSAEEIRARNGYVLAISFADRAKKDLPFSELILLPSCPLIIAPFLEMITAQLFSYYTATTLKRNVDRPRALAKSVTVA